MRAAREAAVGAGRAELVLGWPPLLAPLLFAFQSLVVGETCPAPVDVEARVRAILHLAPERELSEGFAVERHESGLYVELRSADATLIGQRSLPAEGNCDELAQAAAVVLSAWLSDVHPDFAGELPAAVPVRSPDSGLPPPLPAAFSLPQPAAAPASQSASAPSRWELGFGLGADVSGSALAASGYVVGRYWRGSGLLGLSAFAAATWARQEPLGPGFVDWRRWPLGIGPSARMATGSVSWDASVGPAFGWLHFSGSQFDHASSQDGSSWGAFLDLRVASRGRHAGVFGLANAQYYPGDFAARAGGVDGLVRVPKLSLGLAVGFWLSP